MKNKELLPCPFCGGEAGIDREYIFCDSCHIILRFDDLIYNGEAENLIEAKKIGIKTWNTRTNTITVGNGKNYEVRNDG
ncbi:MAG: Lar family restriction alleviation protein [Oscillospiraceae bacterium]|nr:Lar family restriction alleviation protein [Oscillospiraceae bacterium]